MNHRRWIWVLTSVVALGMALGGTQGAAAAAKLPTIKNPSAAKFNVKGSVTLASSELDEITLPLKGSGLVSGNDYQIDVTSESPGGGGSTSFQSTSSQRLIDGKLYSRISTSPGSEGKWFVTDATGVLADNPLGGMGAIIGLDPRFEEFIQTEQVGKEELQGVATTKYKLVIDFKAMSASMGSNIDSLGDVQDVMYLWIGDQDLYIHKVNYTLSIKSASGDVETEISIEYDITFYDFDVPVTIVTPPDAETIDIEGNPVTTGGMPTSMNDPGMGMPGMTSAGMPKSGAGTGNDTMPLALLALAMGLVLTGAGIRRATHSRQSV